MHLPPRNLRELPWVRYIMSRYGQRVLLPLIALISKQDFIKPWSVVLVVNNTVCVGSKRLCTVLQLQRDNPA
jgi:hypothetical protein